MPLGNGQEYRDMGLTDEQLAEEGLDNAAKRFSSKAKMFGLGALAGVLTAAFSAAAKAYEWVDKANVDVADKVFGYGVGATVLFGLAALAMAEISGSLWGRYEQEQQAKAAEQPAAPKGPAI